MKHINASQLQKMQASEPDMLILDVRTPEEYQYLGHIPGSVPLPLHELPLRWNSLNKAQKTVLVCQHGVRSMDASAYLEHQGFTDIYNFEEGMACWSGPLEN